MKKRRSGPIRLRYRCCNVAKKVLALFSGGLDSMLAIKIAQDLGLEVEAVHFTTPFC